MLTDEDVREILQLLDELPYDELHLSTRHFALSVRRDGAGGWTRATEVRSAPRLLAGTPAPASAPEPQPDAEPVPAGLVAVRAPLLGTFYRAPRPGAPPFVEVGSRVDEHTVVGILETMKLMNSVYAGARGTVAQIRLADAQFAGRGAVLMLIEPGG
jgi:acetyl-CoA carboxylase biotin carboxyl carrier protein